MKRSIILIKLGGSVITNKSQAKQADLKKIRQLARELKEASSKISDLILLGHGGGSFPHPPAHRYRTAEGFVREDSAYGLAEVRQACLELNLIVISELIKSGLSAISLAPFDFLTTKNKEPDQLFLPPLLNTLKSKMLPVIYGDAVSDARIGCTIYSTETILNHLASKLPAAGFDPKLVIEIGKTEGVYNNDGQTIPQIDRKNFMVIRLQLAGSESTDVTGGMLHKVEEAYQIAKKGVPTLITSAASGNLKKAILGQEVQGTWIKY